MSPRPILKHSATGVTSSHHGVHFPPSPSLTRTFHAHSATSYDRSPIKVAPNTCALPARGCPGRTYTLDDPAASSCPSTTMPRSSTGHPYGGRVLHPRAIQSSSQRHHEEDDLQRTPTITYPLLPPLIPDLSSESDESDGFVSPSEPTYPRSAYPHNLHGLAIPSSHQDRYTTLDMYESETVPALSFLPHAPSSPTYSPYPYSLNREDTSQTKSKRHYTRERKHESSCDPDRIRSGSDAQGALPSRSSKGRTSSPRKSISLCKAMSSFSITDDGCLGGF